MQVNEFQNDDITQIREENKLFRRQINDLSEKNKQSQNCQQRSSSRSRQQYRSKSERRNDIYGYLVTGVKTAQIPEITSPSETNEPTIFVDGTRWYFKLKFLLHIIDRKSKRTFLSNSGAQIPLIPVSQLDKLKYLGKLTLRPVNVSIIYTFVHKCMTPNDCI